jgi:thiol-disulfide isomerase/thioredoxin
VQLGVTNRLARLQELEAGRLKDPNLPEDDRLELRVQQLQREAFQKKGDGISAALTEMERGVRVLQKEFPKRDEVGGLLLSVAQGWADEGNAEKGRALAGELAGGSADQETKDAAKALLKKLDRVGKPLALKFAAVDGREVDVQKLKGKVVLVDFWATWCGPCIKELPSVKAAYEKLNAKGFEIVGVSFDQNKDALEKLVAKEKMPWPQYFEGGEKGNKFGEEFDISGIPTMWLVDKQGVLRDLNGREKLLEKVEKLLAEK